MTTNGVNLEDYKLPKNVPGVDPEPVFGSFTQDDLPGWTFKLVLDDRLQVAELHLVADRDHPVGARELRKAKLSQMLQMTVKRVADISREYRKGMPDDRKQREQDDQRIKAYAARLGVDDGGRHEASAMKQFVDAAEKPRRNPGRPKQWTHRRLAELAAKYVELLTDACPTPVGELAKQLNYSASNISQRLHDARNTEPPILTPTVRGRCGGALTEYGESLLGGN